jgi:hypothetical protein
MRRLEGSLEMIRLARLDDDELHSQQSSDLGKPRQLWSVNRIRGVD